jgi:hypothetical protein
MGPTRSSFLLLLREKGSRVAGDGGGEVEGGARRGFEHDRRLRGARIVVFLVEMARGLGR